MTEKEPCDLNWKKYEILIKARNFHYENFNKWMTYFYVMIGALFLGLSYVISKTSDYLKDYKEEILLICFAGFIVSVFWHWANKGYYYWNINFITLVNHYERDILKFPENERIYFVFANKNFQNNYASPISGANYSTSKISLLLSYIIAIFWSSVIFYILLNEHINYRGLTALFSFLISSAIILVLSFIASNFLYSKHNHFVDLKIEHPEIQ